MGITEHGPPEVLRIQEHPDPERAPGQVPVWVRAAGINFADGLARVGLNPEAPKPPCVVGYEFAGTVETATGELRAGQHVMDGCRFGATPSGSSLSPEPDPAARSQELRPGEAGADLWRAEGACASAESGLERPWPGSQTIGDPMGRRRSARRALICVVLALAVLAPTAAAAEAGTQDFFEDGIPLANGDNLVVGGRGVDVTSIDPVAALIGPTGNLRRFQTYQGPGTLIEVESLPAGDFMGLLVNSQSQFRLLRFNADLTPDPACGPNGLGPLTTGDANDLVVVDEFIFVAGGLGSDKALFRFELDCGPGADADGSEFEGDGRLTHDPPGEPATIYDIEVGPGVLVTVGYEGNDGEIDVFELDGEFFTPFNGTGQLTHAATPFWYVEVVSDGDQQLDIGDRLITGGATNGASTIGAVAGDGSEPTGLCPGHTGGFFTHDISPTTFDFIFTLDITQGGVVYTGASVQQSNFQPDAYVNSFNLNLCDRSTGAATQNWLELFPSLGNGVSNFIGALEGSGENVFVIGGFDNAANQSFDGFKYLLNPNLVGVGTYGNGGFAPIDLTSQPSSGAPGGGAPGGIAIPEDLPGDFNLNGVVDAADYVVWRKGVLSEDGLRVRMETPDGVLDGDRTQLYNVWRANFGRTAAGGPSAAKRRRRKAIVFARNRTTLRGDESKRVRVPLTKAGRRLVRRYKRKRLKGTLTLTVTYRPASGAAPQKRSFKQKVTLRVKRKRR